MDFPCKIWISLLISFFVVVYAEPARSQSTDTASASQSKQVLLEEIIVTATRRDTGLQQTPVSVGVLTGRIIEDSGILHLHDYWRMIPSLAVTDRGFSGNRISIRGLSGSSGNEADESLTANYLDDTLLISPQSLFTHAPSFKLVDMNRIEVLRGPQGTLFGAGSMGGAIRMITNKADVSTSSQIYETTLSNTAHGGLNYGVTAIWNTPLVQDRSALRLAVYHFDDDGFIDDIGSGEKNANGKTSTGFRLGGTVDFADNFTMTGKIAYEIANADSYNYIDPNGKPSVGLIITDDYQTALMVDDYRDENSVLYNLNLKYSTSIGEFTSVSSYVNSKTSMVIDLSDEMNTIFGTFFPAWWDSNSSQKAFMQEFRFASDTDGKFSWLSGLFYADTDYSRSRMTPAPGVNAICGGCVGPQPAGEELLGQADNDDQRSEFGVFADFSFWLSDRIEASLGARWYNLRRNATEISTGFFADPTTPVFAREFDDSGVNGKGTISFYVNEDVMIYLLASQGFRAGGANELGAAAACNVPRTFEPDSLWNYEIGTKTQFLENRLTVNATAYRIKWSDAQLLVQPGCIFSVGIESGGVTIDGLEAETTFLPNEKWEVTANLGYTKPTLDADIPSLAAPAGRTLAFVPDVTAGISSTYRFYAFANTAGFARADWQYVGSSYNSIDEVGVVPRQEQPSYSLVNFRIGLETDRWRVTLFADNVFDEQAVSRCCRFNGEFTTNRPRTIGIRARFGLY